MSSSPRIRKRLHLDFHNHPTVKGIGSNLTSDGFQAALAELGIDSVVLFAKCHHGLSYYQTAVGTPHPGMHEELLPRQVEACEKAGIDYHFYLSVLRDNRLYDSRPEWRWLNWNGNPSGAEGEWRLVCLNAGYYTEHLKPQIMELVDRFPGAAGIWLDIIRYKGGSCYCPKCVRDARDLGMSPEEFNERMCLETFNDLHEALRSRNKELTLNTIVFFGNQQWRHLGPVEIESILAHVGPFHFPLFSRYLNRYPTERFGITHSFYQNWREFGTAKHPVQMNYEVCQMAFAGFGVSLGDELEPDGTFEPRRFQVLKGGYALADRLSSICDLEAKPVCEIAVLASQSGAAQEDGQMASGSRDSFVRGALKALIESHYQIAVVDPDEDLSPYRCLIAQASQLEPDIVRGLVDRYIARGGRLLLVGSAGPGCLDWLGMRRQGAGNADYGFLEIEPGARMLVRSRMEMLETSADFETVGCAYLPYGDAALGGKETSYIRPADPHSKSPAVFLGRNGSLLYCVPDVLSDYFDRGNWAYADVLRWLLGRLGVPPAVDGQIPRSVEVWLCESEAGYELRVLDCSLKRENVAYAQQTEYSLTRDYAFTVRTSRDVKKVADRITGDSLPFTVSDGAVHFSVRTGSQFLVISLSALDTRP